MTAAFILTLSQRGIERGMIDWAVSAAVLREGRYETLLTHMFAHGSVMHIFMNLSIFYSIAPLLVARFGPPPMAWLRFVLLFLLSGFAGVTVFLALNPAGQVPMLGASGAIYGLIGVYLRLRPDGDGLVPLRSRAMWLAARDFVKDNLILVLLFTLPAFLAGSGGGIAWEAHLGGFLFGLFAGPRFLAEAHVEPYEPDII